MSQKIRRARLSDLAELVRIERAVFDPAKYPVTSRASFAHLIKRGAGEVWCAVDARDAVLGHVSIFFSKRWRVGRLYSIAVDPALQGGSIGKELFDFAEARCRERKLEGMILEIRSDNELHKNRYIQRGYKVLSSLDNYYPDGSSGLKIGKMF